MQLTRTLPLFLVVLFSLVLTVTARRRGDGFARDLVQDVVKRSTELQTMAQANLFADPLVRVVPPKSKAKATCPSGSNAGSGSSSGTSSSPSQTTSGSPAASTEPSSSSSSNSNSDPNSNSISNPDSSSGSSTSSQQLDPPTVTTVLVQPSGSAQNQSPANAQQSSAARRNMSTFGVLSMGTGEGMNAVIVVVGALVVGFGFVL